MSDDNAAAVVIIVGDGAVVSSRITNGPDGPRAALVLGQVEVQLGAGVLTAMVREAARAQHTLGTLERSATPPR